MNPPNHRLRGGERRRTMADAKVFRMGASLTREDVALALEDFLRIQKRLETEGVAQSETSYFIQALSLIHI